MRSSRDRRKRAAGLWALALAKLLPFLAVMFALSEGLDDGVLPGQGGLHEKHRGSLS